MHRRIAWFAALAALVPAPAPAADCAPGTDAVHLNQVGFLPDGPGLAILVTAQTAPAEWRLVDATDALVARGRSSVHGADAQSGRHLHRVDFTPADARGAGLRIVTDCAASARFDVAPGLYEGLPYDALAYFYHNRSGVPIEAALAGSAALARPAAHVRDVAACRSGEDPYGNDWPGCDYTLDVSGGWYDAGDHGKYVVNGGISVWTLMNAWERQQARGLPDLFSDGQAAIPEAGNDVNDLLDEARFELEFLLRMQAPPGAVAAVPVGVQRPSRGLAFTRIDAGGMAHHKVSDRNWTPLPMPPHLDTEERVLFPVSTAATLNLAAVAAQCARIWRDIDAAFAGRCRDAAARAWDAALRNPEVYFIAAFGGSGMYGDSELGDEFFWAAAELLATTGDARYRDAVDASPHLRAVPAEPGWPSVAPLGLITLALHGDALGQDATAGIRERLVAAADGFLDEAQASGYRIPFASERFVWGSNAVLLNRAILLAYAEDFTGHDRYRRGVVDVVDYLLGRNPLDVSFISGYGDRAMRFPHHRYWAPSFDAGLPGPPPGALSGGPNNTAMIDPVAKAMQGSCAPLTCWKDDVEAYALNEVAVNWNAPLVWVAAYLNDP